MCSERIRSNAAELLVGGEEVARRRLRRRRQSARRAQAGVELVGPELDVVAVALVAEADVERHDAPVGEALRCVGEVRGRVEDDRRVLGGESPSAAAAARIASTISSSSWSFADRRPRRRRAAPPSLRRLADAVRRRPRPRGSGLERRASPRRRRARAAGSPSARRAACSSHAATASSPSATDATTTSRPQTEQELERLAEDLVVLDEDDPDRLVTATVADDSLLGREQQRVVRLAARVHVELELGMAPPSSSRTPFSEGSSSPAGP